MATSANRRSVMTLYSVPNSPDSHRTRIVLAEKELNAEIIDVDPDNLPEDLLDLNPYNTVPTLVDRDLVLYDARVIMEYLDERFPHPPLMPVDPVSRARARLALHRVEKDWFPLLEQVAAGGKQADKARKALTESITASAPVFEHMPFFMSEEFGLIDASIAAVLWRLPHYGIELPKQAKAVEDYAERIFARPAFQLSLSEIEEEMRD